MKTVSREGASIIGKDDLLRQIAAKAGTPLSVTNNVIEAFTEVVQENIAKGHEVRLMGFGTWNLRNVAARRVKSIHEGTQIIIPARKRVSFSVGAVLSQAADPSKVKAISEMKSEVVSQKR